MGVADPDRDATHYRDFCHADAACIYSHHAAAGLIRSAWSDPALAGAIQDEQQVVEGGVETTNLLLDIPGASLPGEIVLATAHYDAWYGGANDDGTGVSVLVEAAFALADSGLDRTVRLVLTDGEELGMVGSGRYVEEYGVDGVTGVVNADMVAFVGEQGGPLTHEDPAYAYWVQANTPSEALAFRAADLAGRLPEPLTMKPLVFPGSGVSLLGEVTGVDLADQSQFWLSRAPAIFPFPAGDQPAWAHTPEDTTDVVDVDRLRAFGPFLAATLAAMATEE